MAYTEPPPVITGDLWTAANHNLYLRDNFIDHEARIAAGGGNTLDESYDEGGVGAGRIVTVDSGAVELQGANLLLNLGSYIWPLGGLVLNLDFTGTLYNTVAKCNAVGLRFSGSDTPFSNPLGTSSTGGTWAHTAGQGWVATAASEQYAAITLPLMRPGNWQFDVTLNYQAANVAHMLDMFFGYVTQSGHVGGIAEAVDGSAVATQLQCYLYTNDGDDTYTIRYSAVAPLAGTGLRTYKMRCLTTCPGVWDELDDTWHNYTGHQCATGSYSPAYGYFVIGPLGANVLAAHYVTNLSLTYIL